MNSLSCDYNLSAYRRLLANAMSSEYRFESYSAGVEYGENERVCLLRHDVDAEPAAALRIAELEAELGLKATYFFMLRSCIYNLFSRHVHRIVEQIIDRGHELALHYDQGFRRAREATLEADILSEADIIGRIFGVKIRVVSFHQPEPAILQSQVGTGDLINTYDTRRLRHFRYFSDSNREFARGQSLAGSAEQIFELVAPANIQLLIHPMWWAYDAPRTETVWNHAILDNFEIMQQQLLETERAYGAHRRLRIDDDPD